MLVTLWAFIGIEGASVVSARARKRSDIGMATVSGLLVCLVLYVAASLLALGIMSQPELAQLKNPSMAGVLEHIVGPWGAGLISIAVIISVLGAFLSWTLLAAEVPFIAARDGTMPKALGTENSNRSPLLSLWVTTVSFNSSSSSLSMQRRRTMRSSRSPLPPSWFLMRFLEPMRSNLHSPASRIGRMNPHA